jgi:hypothetical protein
MIKTCLAPTRFWLAFVCMGLLVVIALAYPTAVGAQAPRSENDIPEELWQLYPLDPTKTDTSPAETVQPQLPPPRPQAQPNSAVQTRSEFPNAQPQPSGESDSGRSLAFPVLLLGALLGLLVSLLVVATARNGAFVTAGEYLARARSPLVSPLRAASNAPRHVGHGGAALVSPLRALPRLPRRIGHVVLRLLRAFGRRSSSRARINGGPTRSRSDARHRTSIIERFASTLAYHRVWIIVVAIGISALAVLEWLLFL